jgi:hypothetical protein
MFWMRWWKGLAQMSRRKKLRLSQKVVLMVAVLVGTITTINCQ